MKRKPPIRKPMPPKPRKVVQPPNLSVSAIYALTGILPMTWKRLAYAGRITSYKVSGRMYIPRAEVERIMAEGAQPRKGASSMPASASSQTSTMPPAA